MSRLHAGAASNTSLSLSNGGGWQGIKVVDGLHAHVLVTLTIPDFSTIVSLEIRGAGTRPGALGSVMLNVSRGTIVLGKPTASQPSAFPATITNSSTVELEIFVDGTATEVFVNGGERALTQSAQVLSIEGTTLRATAAHGAHEVRLKAATWPMKRSASL